MSFSEETPYSFSGTFEPGDVEPDTQDRSQLNLLLCAPYGNYELVIQVFGKFSAQKGKGIGWEIEDGKTQVCTKFNYYYCCSIISYNCQLQLVHGGILYEVCMGKL